MTEQQEREALPPLPTAWLRVKDADGIEVPVFRAFQMRDYARAALATKGVPAGWKLVPVEPSDDMQAAGWNTGSAGDGYWDCGNPVDIYRAMLAAAPVAQVSQQAAPKQAQAEPGATLQDGTCDCRALDMAFGRCCKARLQVEAMAREIGRQLRAGYSKATLVRVANAAFDAAIAAAPVEQAEAKPLTEQEAKALCRVGPVYAPDGVVTRTTTAYRQELEAARLHGIREAERAHGIGASAGGGNG